MIGPGTQIGSSGVPGGPPAGVATIATPTKVVAITPVNLTTEGTYDWCALVSSAGAGTPNLVDWHWKNTGGFLRDTFKFILRNGSNTNPNQTDSLFQFSATDPDDARITGSQAAPGNLASNPNYSELLCNNALSILNWGFQIRAKAWKRTRQLNLYLMVSAGGAAINGAVQITAHLSDLSSPDQTVTIAPGVAGHTFWKVPITYNANTDGAELVVSALVSVYGDSGQAIGFMAATQQ